MATSRKFSVLVNGDSCSVYENGVTIGIWAGVEGPPPDNWVMNWIKAWMIAHPEPVHGEFCTPACPDGCEGKT